MTDEFDVDDLGFSPAVSATGATDIVAVATSKKARGSRKTWRKRITSVVVLGAALTAMGGAYAVFATSSGADSTSSSQADIAAGQALYETSCITCHGGNLQGIKDRGPSLAGVGGAAVYFQVSTGRMPAADQSAENLRKTAKFDEQQTEQLAAFVQSIAGGPEVPQGNLVLGDDKLAQGGELFRLNCASCHGSTGKGAPLSAGAVAPGLNDATDTQIYTAMLTGPENMPVFGDNQLTPDQKKAIVTYVISLQKEADPGGSGIDRIGPVSEGLVLWVAGVGALVIAVLWIGAKS
ncbi:menaquinol-cytochrome c reductase cytochrome c1 subunit precursor [Frankineae bacterium MT45]|nr:menaquinol-cytochrome c reductase cytochrome c1 subunit precursor [Frankineae bacterium MT45]